MSRLLKSKENLITQKYKNKIHEAIDLVGTNNSLDYIIAHSEGIVVDIKKDYRTNDAVGRSYGNFVKIQHNHGNYYTFYAHLKYGSVCVEKGEKVKQGDIIGYMGNTGHANGAHLHFEIRDKFDRRIDPTSFLNSNFLEDDKIYDIGRYIVEAEVLNVRKSPYISNDNLLKFEELTINAQNQIIKLNKNLDIPNGLVKGVVCDVSSILKNWGKIPSGWICLDFCKKCSKTK